MDKLDDILRRYTAADDDAVCTDKLLGAAFVVTGTHDTLYSGAAGRLHLGARSARFTDRSCTWVASLTKLATSLCVMQLVEAGRLHLDADLRPLVPELRDARILHGFDAAGRPVCEDNTAPITMRQLLTHTSGFAYDFTDPVLRRWSSLATPGYSPSRPRWSRAEITTPLRFAPGQAWAYGTGLDWAGQILEAVTGTTLGRYMRRHVFDPLGMRDSSFRPPPHAAARTPDNVVRTAAMALRTGAPPTPETHELDAGGAGLFTTAADYALLLRAFLRHALVAPKTTGQMLEPQLDETRADLFNTVAFHPLVRSTMAPEFPDGQRLNYGLAGVVNLDHVPGKRRAGSIAWSGILNSRWWADPTSGIAGVLIVNVRPKGDAVVAGLYDELERAVYGDLLPQTPRSRI